MKDFFGNDLRIGQEVVYISGGSRYGPKASMRKGIVTYLSKSNLVNIKTDTNRHIGRYSNEVVGNVYIPTRQDFYEGENHL